MVIIWDFGQFWIRMLRNYYGMTAAIFLLITLSSCNVMILNTKGMNKEHNCKKAAGI
jgi:hypothetical protein